MERAAFLDRLRARLAEPEEPNLAHPLVPVEGVPRPGYPAAPDVVATLRSAAAGKGWNVRDVDAAPGSVRTLLAEVVEAHAVRRAMCSADPEILELGVVGILEELGVELVPFDGPTAGADVELGVTGAAFAIAGTASVVQSSARSGGRSASLVPPVHLVLVRSRNVLGTPSDLWRDLPARFPEGLPSQVVFASGPSRSADIEFTLTIGVHGPKVVWMGILP